MDRASLRELQEAWAAAVVWGCAREELDGDRVRRPRPCWFGENVPGIDSCEGPIEGAHWIKRQRVERHIEYLCSEIRSQAVRGREARGLLTIPDVLTAAADLSALAGWDPRNGVPACEKHHRRFDSQRMPTLVVWRHEVPGPVESFCTDLGLEVALEDRNPTIGAGP